MWPIGTDLLNYKGKITEVDNYYFILQWLECLTQRHQ